MKSRWVEHNGVRIFISDFSNYGSSSEDVQKEAMFVMETLKMEPPNSVLSVTYVEGTIASDQIVRTLFDIVPVTNAYVRSRTVVGLKGFRKQLVAAFTRISGRAQFKVFDTVEEAMNYLVTQ